MSTLCRYLVELDDPETASTYFLAFWAEDHEHAIEQAKDARECESHRIFDVSKTRETMEA